MKGLSFPRPILVLLAMLIDAHLGYEPADAQVSSATETAAQYVRTALQFELDGDYAYRHQLLTLALKTDPACAAARWHQGQVFENGQWILAENVDPLDQDDLDATYRGMRDRALGDPERELKLARWCNRNRLEDVARLHYTRLLLNTNDADVRQEAIKRLDLKLWHGELVTQETWERNRAQAKAAMAAIKKWRNTFERLRARAEAASARRRTTAGEDTLASLMTLKTIPVVESFIPDSGPSFGRELVHELARLPYYEATQTLMRYALLSPWPNVQEAACAALTGRSLHDFVPSLIAALEAPIKTRYSITFDRVGNVRYQHLYLREGKAVDHVVGTEHISRPVARQVDVRQVGFADGVPLNSNVPIGSTVATQVDAGSVEIAMRTLAAEAEAREAEIQTQNARTNSRNAVVFQVLEQATGTRLKRDPEDWRKWWQGYNETGSNKRTYVEYLPEESNYVAQYQMSYVRSSSCFAAGTPV